MKSLCLLPLLLLIVLHNCLNAAPVGNTAAPQLIQEGFVVPSDCWVDIRIGYEGDFVGNALLEQLGEGSGRVDTFQQYTNSATVTLNILDRLDLFAGFGSSRVCADWRIDLDGIIERLEMETLYHYLWSVGGRAVLLEWGQLFFGGGGRYAYCNYTPSWFTINASPESLSGSRFQWREWQADLDLSYKIDLFTPYLGVKYSSATSTLGKFPAAISNSGQRSNHFHNKNPVGIFIGCSISNGRYFMLNIEGRFVDENAVTITGDLRF
ncbi:MAG: hypothetical protein HY861_02030 [Chlamydiia bacterium]|nr:hypothetical protein [Chlamydiia bacterium]